MNLYRPSRKVSSGALGGAITVLVIFFIHKFTTIVFTAEETGVLTLAIQTIAAYIVPDAAAEEVRDEPPENMP